MNRKALRVNEESRRMKFKRILAAVLGVVTLTAFAACSRSGRAEAPAMEEMMSAPAEGRSFAKAAGADFAADAAQLAPAPESTTVSAVAPTPQTAEPGVERKLVQIANLLLRVADLDSSEGAAQALVASFGGYVASSNKNEASLSMSLRIPRASFDAALAGIKPLGTELWRNVDTEDVTLNWFDLSSRLETKRELMTTLRGYLRSTKSIKDIMAVETRLSELQNEIDNLGGQFRRLADLVDFATINVEFVLPAARVKTVEPTLGERIGDVLRTTGKFFSILVAALVGLVVFGVPIVGLAALLFWLLFGKVGLLLSLFRAVARPGKTKKKGAGEA